MSSLLNLSVGSEMHHSSKELSKPSLHPIKDTTSSQASQTPRTTSSTTSTNISVPASIVPTNPIDRKAFIQEVSIGVHQSMFVLFFILLICPYRKQTFSRPSFKQQ